MKQTRSKWLTRQQARDYSGLSQRTIDEWLATGVLTKHVVGRGRVRVDADQLDQVIAPTPAELEEASL